MVNCAMFAMDLRTIPYFSSGCLNLWQKKSKCFKATVNGVIPFPNCSNVSIVMIMCACRCHSSTIYWWTATTVSNEMFTFVQHVMKKMKNNAWVWPITTRVWSVNLENPTCLHACNIFITKTWTITFVGPQHATKWPWFHCAKICPVNWHKTHITIATNALLSKSIFKKISTPPTIKSLMFTISTVEITLNMHHAQFRNVASSCPATLEFASSASHCFKRMKV